MHPLRIGVQLAAFKLPFKQALQAAARLGVQGVEIDARNELRPSEMGETAIRTVRRLLEDLNLKVTALGFPTRRGYDDVDQLDRRLEATVAALKFAYQLGAPVVVNQVGPIPEESEPRWAVMVSSLQQIAKAADRLGAPLAMQTGPDAPTAVARLLAAVPAEGLRVNLDPASCLRHGHAAEEMIAVAGERVAQVYARDATRDFALRQYVDVPLGRGSVDYPGLLAALEEHGFRGWMTLAPLSSADPAGDCAAGVEFLKAAYG